MDSFHSVTQHMVHEIIRPSNLLSQKKKKNISIDFCGSSIGPKIMVTAYATNSQFVVIIWCLWYNSRRGWLGIYKQRIMNSVEEQDAREDKVLSNRNLFLMHKFLVIKKRGKKKIHQVYCFPKRLLLKVFLAALWNINWKTYQTAQKSILREETEEKCVCMFGK